MIITIDGLCVNGKTTLAKMISSSLNFKNFNTGAIYRCLAYEIYNKNMSINSLENIIQDLRKININFECEKVILNGNDVSKEIREDKIAVLATEWGLKPEIKELVRNIQKEYIKKHDTVMEGRDIGTRIAPNADIKFYLYSNFETRVNRKHLCNPSASLEEIRKSISIIDELDFKGNFIKPENAIEIKTDDKTIEEVYEIMMKNIKEKMNMSSI